LDLAAFGDHGRGMSEHDDREALNRSAAEHVEATRRRLADGRAALDRQRESIADTRRHIDEMARWIEDSGLEHGDRHRTQDDARD
jgi:hypothetical protein